MFDSYLVDMVYAERMKNIYLAVSNEVMAVTLITASWIKKPLIPTF